MLSGFALPQLSILFTPTAHVVHGEQTLSFPLFGFDGKDGPSGMNREPGINNTRAEPPYPFKSEWFRSRPHNPYLFKLTPYYHLRVFSFNRTERWAGGGKGKSISASYTVPVEKLNLSQSPD